MTSFKELLLQRETIDSQCYDAAKAAFEKCQSARIIWDDNQRAERNWRYPDEDPDDRFIPAKGYKFAGYQMINTGLTLNGSQYVGGGDYEHVSITIPTSCIDSLDTWIQEQREILAEKARERRVARQAYNAEVKAEQEQHERDMYEQLKVKYGDDHEI